MRVGVDRNEEELYEGYICTFELNGETHEGCIRYDEDVYSYVFDTLDRKLGSIKMSEVDFETILLQYTVEELLKEDEEYRKWNTIEIS